MLKHEIITAKTLGNSHLCMQILFNTRSFYQSEELGSLRKIVCAKLMTVTSTQCRGEILY